MRDVSGLQSGQIFQPRWVACLLFLLAIVGLFGCNEVPPQLPLEWGAVNTPEPVKPTHQARAAAAQVQPEPAPDIFVGDLDAIKARGRLRILIPANIGGVFYLPRAGWPVEAQHDAAVAFARSQGVEAELVPVENFSGMLPALLEGRGDIIAANMTVTPSRREKISFSVPLTTVKQQVLVAADNEKIKKRSNLAGQRLMVDRGSSFWERLVKLRRRYPGIELIPRPEGLSDEDELDVVASGQVDASIRDSNVASMYLAFRDDLKVAFDLPGTDDIAWGVRPDAELLRSALNKFLHLEFSADTGQRSLTGDLDEIKKRRVLRVLLRNNSASYFLYKGEIQGFEYELAKAFAKANKLRLEVIVPESHGDLLKALREGRGDIAAGFLEPDESALADGVAYSRPYHRAPRHLVVRQDSDIDSAADLNGRTVSVRRSSAYWKDLQSLRAQGVSFEIVAAAEDLETEELIAQVAAGEIEATVADGHLLDIELARGLDAKSGFVLGEDHVHSVAVRAGNPKLLAAVDRFIKKQYKGLTYNILYKKYFTNTRKIRRLSSGRPGASEGQGLSPFDDVTRRFAEQYGFDWRLIVAQMYQESRFDPKAKSFAGARGLMQVMPRTAKFMGFSKISKPEDGIHAGVKYLDWVRNRFESDLPFDERMWFTLAAYNAGYGHVEDARRLAKQRGWDGNSWFDNTERAMLLLGKKKYASKARYGYVRGLEPVTYVRNIKQRYRAYVELSDGVLSQSRLNVGQPERLTGGPSRSFCHTQSHCASANQGAFRRQWPRPCQETQHRVALAQRLPKGRATSNVDCVAVLGKGLPFPTDYALPTMLAARLSVTERSAWPTSTD